ncbi:MAG: SUMF1/EgtB/PvdO family nonheme iron enzyme [Bacteroidales bacterium]|nr:SUMF1/EgtB/PvdO family nonheme iron enzyme [Bacteroidales bacterium]MBN2747923.1 SUMF1/EgtB/PvdO family nonheme iron enzyme [Bacteroidales bacterium]
MKHLWILLVLGCSPALSFPQPDYSFKPPLVYVKGGTYSIPYFSESGTPQAQIDSIASFYIGMYEVSVAEFNQFCKATGYISITNGESNMPITNITATDAEAYCNWLSREYGGTWRLPTSREWDYAAGLCANITETAWYDSNSGGVAHEGGKKQASENGAFDMYGNVWEWSGTGIISFSDDGYQQICSRELLGGYWGTEIDLLCAKSILREDIASPRIGFRVLLEISVAK